MRVAIYCRVSTEEQEKQKTIEGQRMELTRFAKAQGWEIVAKYEDEGISGAASLIERKDLMRLLESAEKREFDAVLVTEHSRLTRDDRLKDRYYVYGTLQENNIQIATQKDIRGFESDSDEIMTHLEGWGSAKERRRIAERFKRGRRVKLKQGIYCLPSVPYGIKRETDRNTKPPTHIISFHPEQYPTLRLIYELIVEEGMSMTECAVHLNKLGKRTKQGRKWLSGHISAILSEEKKHSLTGIIMTNRYKTVKGKDGKERKVERPRDVWVPVKIPQLFTKAEYKRLRRAIDKNRKTISKDKGERFLLRGKVQCGICGQNMMTRTVDGYRIYYICRGKLPEKYTNYYQPCPDSPNVQAEVLDKWVWEASFDRLFEDPQRVLDEWIGLDERGNETEAAAQNSIRAKLKKIDKEIREIIDARKQLLKTSIRKRFTEHEIDEELEELKSSRKALQEREKPLREKLSKLERKTANRKALKEFSASLEGILKRLEGKLDKLSVEEKQKLLDFLIPPESYVEIYPIEEKRLVKIEGRPRSAQVKWKWEYTGEAEFYLLLEALNQWDKTGAIPDLSYSLPSKRFFP